MSDHFYFTFYPTREQSPKHGRATHYLANQGIVTVDDSLANHIYNCVLRGQKPQIYGQGWYDRKRNTFNAGFSIPRNGKGIEFLEHQASSRSSTLIDVFGL